MKYTSFVSSWFHHSHPDLHDKSFLNVASREAIKFTVPSSVLYDPGRIAIVIGYLDFLKHYKINIHLIWQPSALRGI